jgi:hypothetical protein
MNEGVHNYIFLNNKTKKIEYVVNHDKVSKSKHYMMHPEYKNIDVTNAFLKKLLFESFRKYPRQYLLQKDYNENLPVVQVTMLRWLRDTTGIDQLDIDILRSSYITWFYKISGMTFKDKTNLAHQMRHSVASALLYYNKNIQTEEMDTDQQQELITENQILTDKLEKCNDNKTGKKYLKQVEKKRYDIIYRLDHNPGMKPRQLTIDKHKLVLGSDGTWS